MHMSLYCTRNTEFSEQCVQLYVIQVPGTSRGDDIESDRTHRIEPVGSLDNHHTYLVLRLYPIWVSFVK